MNIPVARFSLMLLMFIAEAIAAAQPAVVGVFVTQAREDLFREEIESLGTLYANESVDLTVSVTESVSKVYFDDGDRVDAGQILVEMTREEEQALLLEARVTSEEARRQYERIKSLSSKQTAAESLVDERKREWETARARLLAIESRLQDRLVRAPFAGVVGFRHVSVGALVEPGDVIATLDDDSQMKLDFSVPTRYLSLLEPELDVVATTSAWPDRKFSGKLKTIGSRVDPVSRTLGIRALLPNEEYLLRPGMLMNVYLGTRQRSGILIPEECLVPLGDKQYVLVVNDRNMVERREVEAGVRRPGVVEILKGLSAGEKVITDGQLKVREGTEVKVLAMDDGTAPVHELLNQSAAGKPAP